MRVIAYLFALFAVFLFIACDDDLNSVGSNIQPGGDDINVEVDTFTVKVKTVSLDSIYALSSTALLGKYEDEIFGSIQSDFLCEFTCPIDSIKFEKGTDLTIDSVQIDLNFVNYSGDTLAPMGLSIYKVTSPLDKSYYTNVDPTKYCNMQEVLSQQTYSIAKASSYTSNSTRVRTIVSNLDKKIGYDFYEEYLKTNGALTSQDKFRKFFPGIYVTNTFGTGSLMQVSNTSLYIYYKYTNKLGNYDSTADTTIYRTVLVARTDEVIQLNHVKNVNPSELLDENTNALYMKSPVGLCLELELPIMEIINKMGTDSTKSINAAKFALKGFTEKENLLTSTFGKPTYFLLVDKDSVNTFFPNKSVTDNKTSTIITRNTTTNTYDFGNIATMIMEYKKRKGLTKNPTFLLMPVNAVYSSSTTIPDKVYNYMLPSQIILRKETGYDKMGLIFSKY